MNTRKIIKLTFNLIEGPPLEYPVSMNENETPDANHLSNTVKAPFAGFKDGKARFVIRHEDLHVVCIDMNKVVSVEGVYITIDEQGNEVKG
jgi:hypothetical protein